MRRTIPGSATAEPAPDGLVEAAAPVETPAPLRTEFDFELPIGYQDRDGVLHKRGTMRLATARDELLPIYDGRVKERPAYLTVVLLERVVTKLGSLPEITDTVIENLYAADLAFLQDLYRRINQEGHTRAAVTCPSCQHEFAVDVTGGRQGES